MGSCVYWNACTHVMIVYSNVEEVLQFQHIYKAEPCILVARLLVSSEMKCLQARTGMFASSCTSIPVVVCVRNIISTYVRLLNVGRRRCIWM